MFDKFVLAEIPDEKENPHLFRTVVHHMMHGPCGKLNENNPCMREKACKNHYPREFCSTTSQARNSYPIYRRRNTGITVKVRGAELDNRWVVPYNPYLLAKYDCHLNVEICSTVKAVKYLYKYVYKGHDRVLFEVNNDCDTHQIDEIRQFQSARWISPPEAAWRIFQFHMNEMYPSVRSLQLHLEGMHTIGFRSDQDLNDIAKSERATRSMLTEYFRRNLVDHNARQYYYKEFPEHYVWDETNRLWLPRKRGEAIGRIVAANPAEGERYYLRCLLNHVKGATSYEDLRTVNGVQCNTFREAAEKLGLLEKDNSIDLCMEEAVSFQMPCSLRRLFATLLVFCAPQNPQALWQKFKDELCEDFKRTTTDYYKKALQSINMFLESMGKTLADFNLPESPETYKEKTRREIQDELNVPITDDDLATITNLNSEQKEAFDVIMLAIRNEKGGAFFIDGPGGSGKTYLYRALLTKVRRKGGIALACASTGVAASILPGGRTAHSRFKIPIDTTDLKVCNISKQSSLAELIRTAKLIIWDEISMARKEDIETLDLLLQDIMDTNEVFGGKVIAFGGDFRQTLPVVPRGGREDTINASFVKSKLWSEVKLLHLKVNMRARSEDTFGSYLLRVGNGTEETNDDGEIQIPNHMVLSNDDKVPSKNKLIEYTFPCINENSENPEYWTNRAILTTKNEFVDDLNDTIIDKFAGDFHVYHSFDSVVDNNTQLQQEEYLNSLSPNGIPPHRLRLKKNCPIILMRNIDPTSGLCNGTRLICKNFGDNVIDAEIDAGRHKGERVFLPRIPLQPTVDEKLPFPFIRKQFPVRLCFAMTINKAQGQTLETVGVYLPQPVFSHGQLYVALSRAKSSEGVKLLIGGAHSDNSRDNYTKNVVYTELLKLIGIS